jgi:hypothetical protein
MGQVRLHGQAERPHRSVHRIADANDSLGDGIPISNSPSLIAQQPKPSRSDSAETASRRPMPAHYIA